MKIALLGFGKTGKLCENAAHARGHTISGIITSKTPNEMLDQTILNSDVLIDFSHPKAVIQHLELATKHRKNIIVGTTGWYEQLPQVKAIVEQAQIGCLYAPNFSIGIVLFNVLIAKAAQLFNQQRGYSVGAIDIHHDQKIDAPSGTAKTLAATAEKEGTPKISIASLRVGTIPGIHTFLFDSPQDTITLTHTSHNRQSYAEGAVKAAEWIQNKSGLFTFDDYFAKELL